MTLIRDFSTFYASMFSFVIFMALWEPRVSKKKAMTLSLMLMGPVVIGNFLLLLVLGPMVMSSLLLLTCSLPSLAFFLCLSKYRDGRFLFTFCFADTLVLEIIHVTSILDFYLGDTYWFMVIARLILCPLLALAAWKLGRDIYLELQRKVRSGWLLFAVIALLFYIIMSLAISIPSPITQRPEQMPAYVLLLILIPTIYAHIFSTLRRQQHYHEVELQENILQLQVDNMRSRMEEFRAADEKFRMERHDFRHKLQTIATLVDAKEYGTVQSLVQEYSGSMDPLPLQHYCASPVLDAVLSSFLKKAREEDIRVVTRINFPEELPVSDSELATVFANALENAIVACRKLEKQKRFMQITVLTDPCFMFQIRNSCDGRAILDDDGIPVSTRKNHGFGTRSIVAFCKKNRANFEFRAEDDFFALRVSFH